ncbi:MAG: sigma 54-interacting transcriptional regulator [Deltaproteobacteria bacterium]|nr:sigma 54-interacting transcriptional regulator [Deltaproteobacteria bacterium]
MKLNDAAFFQQATKKICSSLDVQEVLTQCLNFFQQYLPLESITLNVYDPQSQSIVNVATVGQSEFRPTDTAIYLPPETCRSLENERWQYAVEIINHPEKNQTARFVWEAMGKKDVSFLALKLLIDDQKLGVVVLTAKGFDRYNQEHARLFTLLHDPFAIALANALQHQEVLRLKDLLADDNQFLNQQLHHISGDEIIGADFGLKYVMEMVHKIAPQSSHVLLLGETGVGKEVIANAIHYSSSRVKGPFIKVNCGAIPESLIDSELFGHEKGAFTGALSLKRGRFERANKGTLFLDEIGELPLSAQVRLLRVLQNKEIERVGGTQAIAVDVRIITATHRDLPKMISQGKFREDLWFRLNVFPITIPPLRQRKSDIPALIRFFVDKKTKEMNLHRHPVLAYHMLEKLQDYHWPGNVRELENLVERTIIQNITKDREQPLQFELPPSDSNVQPPHRNIEEREWPLLLDDVIRDHILTVLKMSDGRVQGDNGAATRMGINPNTLRNRMKKLGIPYGRNEKTNTNGLN